jgi:hypothetical protein
LLTSAFSGADKNVSNIDFTKTQLGVLAVVMFMAVDSIK